jgi:hypothetical protein
MKFSFKNLGHYFAVAGHMFVKSAQFLAAHQAELQGANNVAMKVEQIAGVDPGVVALQAAAAGSLGHVLGVIDSGKPRNADGSLDLGTIEGSVVDAAISIKGTVDQFARATGIPKPTQPLVGVLGCGVQSPAVTVVK